MTQSSKAAALQRRLRVGLSALSFALVWALLEYLHIPLSSVWAEQLPLPSAARLALAGLAAGALQWPPLIPAWAVYLANLARAPDFLIRPSAANPTRNPLDFRLQSSHFVGRGQEISRLASFTGTAELYLSWAVVGAGGIGKSRLGLEWVSRMGELGWDAGFWSGHPDELREWVPRRPTAIVLDDAGRTNLASELLAELTRKHQHGELRKKVRLLLIERDLPLAFEDSRVLGREVRDYSFADHPLTLGALGRAASEELMRRFAADQGRAAPSGEDARAILSVGEQSPFWLLLAVSSYLAHGGLRWRDQRELLRERVTVAREKWQQLYELPLECEELLLLAILTRGFDPEDLRLIDQDTWATHYDQKESYYRLVGALTPENDLVHPMHDLLAEFYLLHYTEQVDRGRIQPQLSPPEMVQLSLYLNHQATAYSIARLRVDFTSHPAVDSLDLKIDDQARDDVTAAAWVDVRAHILGMRVASEEQKKAAWEELREFESKQLFESSLTVQEALYRAYSNVAMWRSTAFLEAKNRAERVDLTETLECTLGSIDVLEDACRRWPTSESIVTSLARTLLASIWVLVGLGPKNQSKVAQLVERMEALSKSHSAAETQYAKVLRTMVCHGLGDREANFSRLKEIAQSREEAITEYVRAYRAVCHHLEDARARFDELRALLLDREDSSELYASALVSSLGQGVVEADLVLQDLRDLAARDPVTVRFLANGLIGAIARDPVNSESYLEELRRLSGGRKELKERLAEAYVAAISQSTDGWLKSLRQLRRLVAKHPRLRTYLARGLVTALSRSKADHPALLKRLRRLSAKDPSLEAYFARGIVASLSSRGGSEHPDLLQRLRELTRKKPALRPYLARGLVAAIYAGSSATESHLDELARLTSEDPALRARYLQGIGTQVERGQLEQAGLEDALRRIVDAKPPVLNATENLPREVVGPAIKQVIGYARGLASVARMALSIGEMELADRCYSSLRGLLGTRFSGRVEKVMRTFAGPALVLDAFFDREEQGIASLASLSADTNQTRKQLYQFTALFFARIRGQGELENRLMAYLEEAREGLSPEGAFAEATATVCRMWLRKGDLDAVGVHLRVLLDLLESHPQDRSIALAYCRLVSWLSRNVPQSQVMGLLEGAPPLEVVSARFPEDEEMVRLAESLREAELGATAPLPA